LPWSYFGEAPEMRFLPALVVGLAGAALSAQVPKPAPIKQHDVLTGHTKAVLTVAFSADGKVLASGSRGGTIRLWDVRTGKVTLTLSDPSTDLPCLAFSPDGRTLATSVYGGKRINLLDVETGKDRAILEGHRAAVHSLACSPDGKTLASASLDGTARLWDLKTGEEQATLGRLDEKLILWLEKTDRKQPAVELGGMRFRTVSFDSLWGAELSVSFSPDSKTLAYVSNGRIILWDVKTGKERTSLKANTNRLRCVAYSPDGKTLASGGADNPVQLWDVKTGKEKTTLKGHNKAVIAWPPSPNGAVLAFSPDVKTLASGGDVNAIILWDVTTGKQQATLEGHADVVSSVAFSPDGKMLASGSWDKTVILWDVKAGNRELPR
jgi:WD40 repeat protein